MPAGVVQQALAHAWRRGSDVRGASQARPTRTRAPSLMLLNGHAVLLAWLVPRRPRVRRRPSVAGRRWAQRRGRAPGVVERRAVVNAEREDGLRNDGERLLGAEAAACRVCRCWQGGAGGVKPAYACAACLMNSAVAFLGRVGA